MNSERMLAHRSDIQGLRGVAIALVLVEHSTKFLTGGFIGVDVFFVISGFVITTRMLADAAKGEFRLSDFYARRIRRLLPALVVVLVATQVLAVLLLSPGQEQGSVARTGLSAFFFTANITYLLEGGYFFLGSDPLRHMWSLGVEEQFYIAYPVAFLAVAGLARQLGRDVRKLAAQVFAVAIGVSLLSATFLAHGLLFPASTRLSFFLTPFRLWELLAGALAAVLLYERSLALSRSTQVAVQYAGVAFILLSAFQYGPFTLFPGASATPAVLGAILLLLPGQSITPIWSPLSNRLLTSLGDVSYGLYLWHWPLIVFAGRLRPGDGWLTAGAVGLAIVLSTIQLHFVENPIRRGRPRPIRPSRILATGATVVLLASGSLLVASNSGLGIAEAEQFATVRKEFEACVFADVVETAPVCSREGQTDERILLIGDSQAAAISPAVADLAETRDASLRIAFTKSCPVHLRPNERLPHCEKILQSYPVLVEHFRPSIVIIANASDLYVTRGGLGRPDTLIRAADGTLPMTYEAALESWVEGVHGALSSSWLDGLPVVYLQMIPVAPVRSPSLVQQNANSTPFNLAESLGRNLVVGAERTKLDRLDGVEVIDPAAVLCIAGRCALSAGGGSLYEDPFHLNSRGAALLSPVLAAALDRAASSGGACRRVGLDEEQIESGDTEQCQVFGR